MKSYNCDDYLKLYLEQSRLHWSDEIRKYDFHLYVVLSKAFRIDLERLFKKYKFLEEIILTKSKLTHPLSGALEVGLVLDKFPEIKEILYSVDKQRELLVEIIKKVIEKRYPKKSKRIIKYDELVNFGYKKSLEPDYGKIYEDY